eukprot:364482-Chlamydomonas_euryale.AAC.4
MHGGVAEVLRMCCRGVAKVLRRCCGGVAWARLAVHGDVYAEVLHRQAWQCKGGGEEVQSASLRKQGCLTLQGNVA